MYCASQSFGEHHVKLSSMVVASLAMPVIISLTQAQDLAPRVEPHGFGGWGVTCDVSAGGIQLEEQVVPWLRNEFTHRSAVGF
jgi:hypothetical protein